MGADILCIGEVLIEFGPAHEGAWRVCHGGNACLTAIHLSHILGPGRAAFVSRIGDDPFSRDLHQALLQAGVDLSLCEQVAGGVSSLRLMSDGDDPVLWHADAPAARTFDGAGSAARLAAIGQAPAVHLTGSLLARLPGPARLRVLNAARAAARRGTVVSFDPEYRPELWRDAAAAAEWCARAYRTATLVLVSEADEEALFGRVPPDVGEKIVRRDEAPVAVHAPAYGLDAEVEQEGEAAVDRSGADAAFNGAYLAARIEGADPFRAAQAGARLAAYIAARPGALPQESAAEPPQAQPVSASL